MLVLKKSHLLVQKWEMHASRTPAGVTVMLKRGDASLFGKVTEWWNLTKRMRHIMDLRKHMREEPLSCGKHRVVPRFVWGQFCYSCNPSNADEGLRLFVKLNYSNLFILKPKGQRLLSDSFRQNSRGRWDLKPKIWSCWFRLQWKPFELCNNPLLWLH